MIPLTAGILSSHQIQCNFGENSVNRNATLQGTTQLVDVAMVCIDPAIFVLGPYSSFGEG